MKSVFFSQRSSSFLKKSQGILAIPPHLDFQQRQDGCFCSPSPLGSPQAFPFCKGQWVIADCHRLAHFYIFSTEMIQILAIFVPYHSPRLALLGPPGYGVVLLNLLATIPHTHHWPTPKIRTYTH